MQLPIDRLDQPRAAGEKMNRPDPPGAQPLDPVGQLIVDVARTEHGLVPDVAVMMPNPAKDTTLALGRLPLSNSAHSKCLLACSWLILDTPQEYAKNEAFRVFS